MGAMVSPTTGWRGGNIQNTTTISKIVANLQPPDELAVFE